MAVFRTSDMMLITNHGQVSTAIYTVCLNVSTHGDKSHLFVSHQILVMNSERIVPMRQPNLRIERVPPLIGSLWCATVYLLAILASKYCAMNFKRIRS